MSPSKIFITELMVDKFTEMTMMPGATRVAISKLIKKMGRVR